MNIVEIISVISSLFGLLALALVYFSVEKFGVKDVKKIVEYVKIAVYAAEQYGKLNGYTGIVKKDFALKKMKSWNDKFGWGLSIDDIDLMIEASVNEKNEWQKKILEILEG